MPDLKWWQTSVIYQIYPRSFQDSTGDGCGDLRGIIGRLDYLKWLGADAVWLSPIFPSPMADFGYDVSNYVDIHPMFGTLEDFDALRDEVHRRDMKILLDFVPNHTSSEHDWFIEARSSRDSPKRDWYLWADPEGDDGGPPNNWLSAFGGPAWEFDEATGQYYYHAFLAAQPDLNWRNPDVRAAMYDVLRFWLDRDVDGFRIDVIWHLIKDKRLRDNPHNPHYDPNRHAPYESLLPVFTTDQPEVHEIVREMRCVVEEIDHERVIIGEVYLPVDRLVTYYGDAEAREAHLPFNFTLIQCPWDARQIEAAIDEYEGSLPDGAWPNWVLGNHDQPRVRSRVGPDQARVAAMLLLTLHGTPTMYYGDEIGMTDVDIPPDRVRDPQQLQQTDVRGRDPERTPMQWDSGFGAGFTTSDDPWLPISPHAERCNVELLRDDEGSILNFYRELLRVRREIPALYRGVYAPRVECPRDVISFERHQENCYLIALNLGLQEHRMPLRSSALIVFDSGLSRRGEECVGEFVLHPNEGLILRLPESQASHQELH